MKPLEMLLKKQNLIDGASFYKGPLAHSRGSIFNLPYEENIYHRMYKALQQQLLMRMFGNIFFPTLLKIAPSSPDTAKGLPPQ